MERTIFLKSSARERRSYRHFFSETGFSPEKSDVCFITTAADGHTSRDFLDKDRQTFKVIGFKSVLEYDITGKNRDTIYRDLESFNIIFLSGGNAFYFLKRVRETDFGEVVAKLLESGKAFMTASGATIVFSTSIEPILWKNPQTDKHGVENFDGLGIVPFVLLPHFDPSVNLIAQVKARETGIPMVGLSDHQALLGIGDQLKIVGEGKKITFNSPAVS